MHTPFGGMIGAHRTVMRKLHKASPKEIEADFERRVSNVMGATTMLSLASTIDNGDFATPQRVGCFSYGSGCCSEFFSGIVRKESQQRVRALRIREQHDQRCELSMENYGTLLKLSYAMRFGTRNVVPDTEFVPEARTALGGRRCS